ncbi:hypothetical protein CAI21_01105 [Alkalilimnicola ehrlichii]|nr:hypothetical protein CAI21_01105 [Alkalilimnicola ehrlichii]
MVFGYADWLRLKVLGPNRWQGAFGVFAFLLPPVLLVALVQWWLGGWFLGLVLGVAALVFAHGPSRVDDDLDEFLASWEQEDVARARRAASELSGEEESPAAMDALPEEAVRGLFWQSYERLLGPIFWFVLLGAWGVVLFRLAYVAKEYAESRDESSESFGEAANLLVYVLDWIPTRLAALAYGLAGSFVHSMEEWKQAAEGRFAGNRVGFVGAAMGALNLSLREQAPEAVRSTAREARSLVTRAVLCWLAVIALLTIAGWLG